jgi:hypothetical protein
MSDSNDDLVKRIADLERELAELKAALPPVEKEFVASGKWPLQFDPLDGVGMSGSALKPMVDLVNPKGVKFDRSAWARNSYPQPGGFGTPAEPGGARKREVDRSGGWRDQAPLGQSIHPQSKWSK